jgi:hypothetical protein
LEEKTVYYGEKIVLKETELGLSTCWVALTYSKSKTICKIDRGEITLDGDVLQCNIGKYGIIILL